MTRVEKVFKHGFRLNEQELRRLYDVLHQQMKLVLPEDEPIVNFEVKFRNGTVMNASSITDVLAQENSGSILITGLEIEFRDKQEKPSTRILLSFTNPASYGWFGAPVIVYTVEGENRDWVFTTSSKLEDRIGRIKSFAPRRYADWPILVTLTPLLLFMALLIQSTENDRRAFESRQAATEEIVNQWNSGRIKDNGQFATMLNEAMGEGSKGNYTWSRPLKLYLAICLAGMLCLFLFFGCSPVMSSAGVTIKRFTRGCNLSGDI